jgi:hypothetical protein
MVQHMLKYFEMGPITHDKTVNMKLLLQ